MLRHLPLPLILLPLLAPAVPARAGDAPRLPPSLGEQWRRAEDLARAGIGKLLESLEALRDAVPQYGTPYMDPHGNIVIPRRPPAPAPGTPVPPDQPFRT